MTVMSDADASVVIFLAKNLSQWLNWLQTTPKTKTRLHTRCGDKWLC